MEEHKEIFVGDRDVGVFGTLIVVMVSRVCAYVQTHQDTFRVAQK